MANKITVRSQFEAVREVLEAAGRNDLVEFIDGRIAQTVRKSTGERKPTAKQLENEGFKADLVAYMEPDVVYASSDLLAQVPSIVASGMSVNRVSALLSSLEKAGAVTKTTEKGKNYWTLAQ